MRIDRLDVTWLSAAVPETFDLGGVFGGTEAMKNAWRDPSSAPPAPLAWRYPWLDNAGGRIAEDTLHWENWCDMTFTGESREPFVNRLLTLAVPLVADTTTTTAGPVTGGTIERAELFLHPWAVSSAMTAKFRFPQGVDLAAAAGAVTAFRHVAEVTAPGIGPTKGVDPVTLGDDLVAAALKERGLRRSGTRFPHAVVATVIAGDPEPRSAASPTNQTFCDAMRELAGDALPGVPMAWIKVDTGTGSCVETLLCDVLTTGVSQWFHHAIGKMPTNPQHRTLTWHRRTVLRLIVLRSVHLLCKAHASPTLPGWLQDLRIDLLRMMAAHYGPSKAYGEYLAQAYVDVHGINELFGDPTLKLKAACP